jgi:membrane protein implicated in regulation of membrane protease activity
MKKDSIAIIITSIVLLVYCVLAALSSSPLSIVIFLFIALHVLLIWMVYRILKQPTKVEDTFDEKFYQDRDFER